MAVSRSSRGRVAARAVAVVMAVCGVAAALLAGPAAAAQGSWSVVTSPSPGSTGNILGGVACVAADDCTAVGSYNNGGGGRR